MLNKIGSLSVKFGYRLLLFISILWAIVSIGYSTTLIDTLNTYGYILVFLTIFLLISQTAQNFLKKAVVLVYRYRYLSLFALLIYQLVIILSNSVLVYGDTTAIIGNIRGQDASNYFSANPNNLLYGLYVKGLYHLVGMKYLVLVQELINIFILDISIVAFSKNIEKNFDRQIAAIYFILSVSLIGLHPQFLSTYTDYWSYFTATFVCIISIKIIVGNVKLKDYISLAIFIGLGYLIRPTIMIYAIALAFALLLRVMLSSDKQITDKVIKGLLTMAIGLVIFTGVMSVVKKTDILTYRSGYDKNLAYFFDLGLTSTGAAHIELPPEALDQNNPDEVVEPLIAKDIKARLKHYSLKQAVTKFKIAFQEGNLGWRIEQPLSVLKFQKNQVTSKFIDSKFGQKIRSYLFFQGNNFANLDFFLQIIWIVIIYGIIYQLFSVIKGNNFSMIQLFLALSILGAFMYLMLFEAGRSRYLISFLPVLSLMSAFGYQAKEENSESKYWTKSD